MYYRGSRVPLSEKSPRFHTAGVTYGVRLKADKTERGGGKRLFLHWGQTKEKPTPFRSQAAHAFYRPGVTPVEETPAYSARKKAWAPRIPGFSRFAWILKLAGLALLALAVVWSKNRTTAMLQDVAGLKLERVSVDGNHYLSDDEVIQTAALPLGESMFRLDLNGALERVQKMDWVDSAFIERRLPRSIVISVRERRPVALLDSGDLYGVGPDGRVLPPAPALLREDLPLISGLAVKADDWGTTATAEALKPALDFLSFLRKKDPVLAQDVSEVNLSEADSLKVTFIDGIQATFNTPVDETELRRMALVLSDLSGKGKHAAAMDFRYRGMVLVKTREAQ